MSLTRTPYYIGRDQVIRDDVSAAGLCRMHAIRRGGMPDVENLPQRLPRRAVELGRWAWMGRDGTGHFYIVWREG